MKKKRTLFLGWTNIKWFFNEIMKLYSSEESYFSKKRVESGVAFLLGQFGMMFYLIKKVDSMDSYELGLWAGIEFLIAGYTVNQIQKEKKTNRSIEPPMNDIPPDDSMDDSEPKLLHD